MSPVELLVALVIAVGLVGIVLPVLPGTLLILGAVLAWAVHVGTGTAWAVFAAATTLLVVGSIVKYAVPGRSMRTAGVPMRSLVAGGLLGIVGFFVVPVVGLVLGFVGGIYLVEHHRLGGALARRSTITALKAVGLSLIIELAAGLLAAATWAAGVLLT